MSYFISTVLQLLLELMAAFLDGTVQAAKVESRGRKALGGFTVVLGIAVGIAGVLNTLVVDGAGNGLHEKGSSSAGVWAVFGGVDSIFKRV